MLLHLFWWHAALCLEKPLKRFEVPLFWLLLLRSIPESSVNIEKWKSYYLPQKDVLLSRSSDIASEDKRPEQCTSKQ